MSRLEAVTKYNVSEKGKATRRRYEDSAKGKETKRGYYKSEGGKAVARASYRRHAEERKACVRRYKKENAEKVNAYERNYRSTPKGRVIHAKITNKYLASEKGELWRRRHGIHSWYRKALYLISVEERPCVVCDEADKMVLECDHILARCLGGTDDWDNLQVLCKSCHRTKTKQDMILWRRNNENF